MFAKIQNSVLIQLIVGFCAVCLVLILPVGSGRADQILLDPNAQSMNGRAPEQFRVRMKTSKGLILLDIHRDWAPYGVDRFYNLVSHEYYNQNRFFRVTKGRWAQFGVNGSPKIAQIWRTHSIPDDPRVQSNVRGTIAYAFAVPHGRTTQLFINLRDNSPTHDKEPFVPIGRVVEGMDVADRLYSDYGEKAGSGIRSGEQEPLFQGGNTYLKANFPLLDWIETAVIVQ